MDKALFARYEAAKNKRVVFASPTGESGQPLSAATDDSKTLTGYSTVWGAVSTPMGDGVRYTFSKGAIVWLPEVFALWHHDYASPVAGTSNGTLTLTEDDKGVAVSIMPDDTTAGVDCYKRVKSQLARGMSFGGVILDTIETSDPEVREVTLFVGDEVTITCIPAMVETSIQAAAPKEATAELVEKDDKKLKDSRYSQEKKRLEQLKLASLKFGKVSK